MRKTKTAAAMVLLAGLILWGCGDSQSGDGDMEVEAAEDLSAQVEVRKDGSITETLVEDFAEEYYDEESLRNMLLAEVAEFNKSHGDAAVSVDKLEREDGAVTVQLTYPSAEIYSQYNTDDYNEKKLYCGTVKDAYDAGYPLDVSMQDTKGENTIGKQELLEMGEQYILITDDGQNCSVGEIKGICISRLGDLRGTGEYVGFW